ncbi:integrator complex subunit 6-like isoform X2 [Macrotis lagotis]|uniref:integrator complex subunit 6-like isoform X2 n=1 Tax=Macrotis lagotis TaxID=92651 RepID=UPI003D682AC6
MPIILFLLDTSASMNQRTDIGTTYLDIAKNSVEIFLKLRSRDPASRADRYMLVTCEEPPYCIKAGWRESHTTFMTELKNLHASGLTTLGQALKSAFDLLNMNRLVSGIDNYGQGRNPFFLEPALLIVITDGSKLTNINDVQEELQIPLTSPLPGSELTKEPFRWDQRVFALVLRIPGMISTEPELPGGLSSDDSVITQMCEVTGGRSYCIRTQKMLNQCLELLLQKIQNGVVVQFEKSGPDPTSSEDLKEKRDEHQETFHSSPFTEKEPWYSCRKMIYVRSDSRTGVPFGHWPIPESFWPDQSSPTLPPRTAHPIVHFTCKDSDPVVIEKMPFDKYEIESSPLTQYILKHKSPLTCWQVFVANSGKYSELEHPFGYLKASRNLKCVNLFILPYNYPVLFPLLDELFKVHKLNPSPKWRQEFDEYLKSIPAYFLSPLKKALRMMGAINVIVETSDSGLNYNITNYLKKLSHQSKVEVEKRNALVGTKPPQERVIRVKNFSSGNPTFSGTGSGSQMPPTEANYSLVKMNGKEASSFKLAMPNKDMKPCLYKNPYDIPRNCLLDQLNRMRARLLSTNTNAIGQNQDSSHSIPITQMGNYQEYLKSMPPPLREIDSEQPRKTQAFGNPFKQIKKGMMVDETDEFIAGPSNKRSGEQHSMGSPKKKRNSSPSSLLKKSQATSSSGNDLPSFSNPQELLRYRVGRESDNYTFFLNEQRAAVAAAAAATTSTATSTAATAAAIASISAAIASISAAAAATAAAAAAARATAASSAAAMAAVETASTSAAAAATATAVLEVAPAATARASTSTSQLGEASSSSSLPESEASLKVQILKEVRKPGRNYEKIFTLLGKAHGSVEMQKRLIFVAIREAARFKKKVLIRRLESLLEEIHVQNMPTNSNNADQEKNVNVPK